MYRVSICDVLIVHGIKLVYSVHGVCCSPIECHKNRYNVMYENVRFSMWNRTVR